MATDNPYTSPPVDTSFEPADALSPEAAAEQARQLTEALNYHNHRYYVDAAPSVSDEVYDALFRRLQDLEATFPELQSETSPTQRVGAA
ncbi:MAG: NAD-dependent DNA ligase LigA, partial [Spirochaetia bacterium]